MSFGSLRLSCRIREKWNLIVLVFLVLPIMALTGCGLMPFGKKEKSPDSALPPPALSELAPEETAPSALAAPLSLTPPEAPLLASAQPPETGESSPDPALAGYVQVPAPEPSAAPPAEPMDPLIAAGPLELSPEGGMGSLGLNLETYFDATEEAPERLAKLERAVSSIQRDLRTLAPPIRRLITVERDLQALIGQLTQLTQSTTPAALQNAGGSAAAMPQTHPTSTGAERAPPPPQPAAPSPEAAPSRGHSPPPPAAPPPDTGGIAVKQMRTGEHSDKTRIVFDLSGTATYRYDLDNTEHLLVIELPGTSWRGPSEGKPAKSPLISSWSAGTLDGGGSRVVVQLKKETAIVYETTLKGGGGQEARIVLDLQK